MTSKRKSIPANGVEGSRRSRRRSSSSPAVASNSVSGSVGDAEEDLGVVFNNGDCQSTSQSPLVVAKKEKRRCPAEKEPEEEEADARFSGDPVPDEEARQRCRHRYQNENRESNTFSTEDSVIGPINNELVMDYTLEFTTSEYFESRDELVRWVCNIAKGLGMVIVVKRSDGGEGGRQPRLLLSCERSGEYREFKGKSSRGTKKCGCPFVLKGSQISIDGQWALKVVCAVHNHPCTHYSEGHSFAGRLTPAEEKLVVDMSKNNYQPKDILHILKERYPQNMSTIKTIYNARRKHRLVEHGGRSQLQYLMAKLQEHRYFYHHRRCEKSNTVKDIFFAHPTSIDLLRAFSGVLLMDCTYKTNRYKLPLLQIIGVTSTDITFSIACAYTESEHEDNYMWALSILKSLFDQSSFPTVIVTDREVGLMNAIESTFPTSRHFLCRWHISRNILANCKKLFRSKERWDSFMLSWNVLVLAATEGKFHELLKRFQEDYSDHPDAVKYVMNHWIQPYKDRFVSCWINNVMHFNNTTVNRAESVHAKLKKQLGSSQGNLETCWTRIHALIEMSHIAIKQSFAKSINVIQQRYKPSVFKSLRGMVSITALDKILKEMEGVNAIGVDPLLCGCVVRKTCGLPCAHEIAKYVRVDMPIPLDIVDSFWKKLDMEPSKGVDISFSDDIDSRWSRALANLNNAFLMANESEKLLMLKKLTEFANLTKTSLLEPEVNAHTRDQP